MAFRRWADDGPLSVLIGFSLLHSSTIKHIVRVGPLLQNFLDPRMYSAHYKLCGLLITINELVMAVYLTLYVLMDFSILLLQISG